jgi:hypothetical protein
VSNIAQNRFDDGHKITLTTGESNNPR